MRTFYKLVDDITNILDSSEFVNTVSYGDIFETDLEKQSIYPVSHFIVGNGSFINVAWNFEISVICMDLVDQTNEDYHLIKGKSNEHDIFNTQLQVVNKLCSELRRGDSADSYELIGEPTVEPFKERFQDDVAGWVVTFNVQVRNDYSVC